MSPIGIGWLRVRALPAVLLCGCGGSDLPERLFDAAIDCRPNTAPVLSTVAEAIALLDADGDGVLTDADLSPGETAVILALTGTHEGTGEVSDPGFTIHTVWSASVFAYPAGSAYWGVEVTTNCLPMLNVFVNFGDDTLPPGPVLQGEFEGRSIGIDVANLEMHDAEGTMDARIFVTEAADGRVSGYMFGSGSSALVRVIPEEALTGQKISVEAFAFRDIVDEEAE